MDLTLYCCAITFTVFAILAACLLAFDDLEWSETDRQLETIRKNAALWWSRAKSKVSGYLCK